MHPPRIFEMHLQPAILFKQCTCRVSPSFRIAYNFLSTSSPFLTGHGNSSVVMDCKHWPGFPCCASDVRARILGFKVHAALLLGQPYTQQLCTWWLLRMISFYDWAPTQQSGTTGQQLVWGLAWLRLCSWSCWWLLSPVPVLVSSNLVGR